MTIKSIGTCLNLIPQINVEAIKERSCPPSDIVDIKVDINLLLVFCDEVNVYIEERCYQWFSQKKTLSKVAS